MTFTYDPTLSTNISWIRLQIGDSQEHIGARPGDNNFSDEEITAILTGVSNDETATIANLFRILSTEWTKLAVSYTMGPRKEDLFRIAEGYAKLADQWSDLAGIAYISFSSGMKRAGSNANSGTT